VFPLDLVRSVVLVFQITWLADFSAFGSDLVVLDAWSGSGVDDVIPVFLCVLGKSEEALDEKNASVANLSAASFRHLKASCERAFIASAVRKPRTA